VGQSLLALQPAWEWIAAAVALLLVGSLAMLTYCYRKARPGTLLVCTGLGGPRFSFDWAIVLPVVQRCAALDLGYQRLTIERRGTTAVVFADGVRGIVKTVFYVQVTPSPSHLTELMQEMPVEQMSDRQMLEHRYTERLNRAIESAAAGLSFSEAYADTDRFKQAMFDDLENSLKGHYLEDIALDHFEKVPKDSSPTGE